MKFNLQLVEARFVERLNRFAAVMNCDGQRALVGVSDVLVSADSTVPTALLIEALEDRQVDEFTDYESVTREGGS